MRAETMLYSQMTEEDRQKLLDNSENYPLLVRFQGKTGLLFTEEVDFLRKQGVDFDVEDEQVVEVLGSLGPHTA